MTAVPFRRSKFVTGDLSTGQLILIRDNGKTAQCDVVIVTGVALTDNEDSTYDLTFD